MFGGVPVVHISANMVLKDENVTDYAETPMKIFAAAMMKHLFSTSMVFFIMFQFIHSVKKKKKRINLQ